MNIISDTETQEKSSFPIKELETEKREENLEKSSSSLKLLEELDQLALEDIVEHKISRFLDKLGSYYPEDLHSLIIQKVDKPLLKQILLRTGGNQVHAARILGINRNTLRKKIKLYSL